MNDDDNQDEINYLDDLVEKSKELLKIENKKLNDIQAVNENLDSELNELKSSNLVLNNENKNLIKKIDYLKSNRNNKLGFNFKFTEVLNNIPSSILEGLGDINNEFEKMLKESTNINDLHNVDNQMNDDKSKAQKNNYLVLIKYLGDTLKIRIYDSVNEYDYLNPLSMENLKFNDILIQACDYFEINSDKYILRDELNTIWVRNSLVLEYFEKINSTDYAEKTDKLTLYLVSKKAVTHKSKKIETINEDEDNKKVSFDPISNSHKEIANLLEQVQNESNDQVVQDLVYDGSSLDEQQLELQKLKERKQVKQVETNKAIFNIEKSFGKVILKTIFYMSFAIIILMFFQYKNSQSGLHKIHSIAEKEFMKTKFNYTYEYFLDTITNYNLDYLEKNEKDYSLNSELNLFQVKEVDQIRVWIVEVLFKKLNIVIKEDNEINKLSTPAFNQFGLLGNLRFFQIRDTSYSSCNTNQYLKRNNNIFDCFHNITEVSTDKTTQEEVFNLKSDIVQNFITKINKNEINLLNSKLLLTKSILPAFKEISLDYPFTYSGYNQFYQIKNGYLYEIPLYLSLDKLQEVNKVIDFLNKFWIDNRTNLLMISFNYYDSNLDDNIINSISFCIEQSKNGLIRVFPLISELKMFFNLEDSQGSVEYFSKNIKLEALSKTISNEESAISRIFNVYFFDVVYFIMLLIYSIYSLTNDILKIKNEDKTFIYTKEFTGWLISLVANLLILVVLVLRISFLIFQSSLLKKFKKNGFVEYFPVNYYYYNYELFIAILELVMLIVVLMNISNIFYPEFFLLIKYTFNKAGRFLLSYFILLTLIILSIASTFWVIFNPYIHEFQTFALSIYSVFFLENLSNSSLKLMMETQYFITFAMIIVYLFFAIFYLNFLFVILLDSFTIIKKKNPLNLIKMETIYEGVRYYFENLYIVAWKFVRKNVKILDFQSKKDK